jgi:hypothetical protein
MSYVLEMGTEVWDKSVGQKCGTEVWDRGTEVWDRSTELWNRSVGTEPPSSSPSQTPKAFDPNDEKVLHEFVVTDRAVEIRVHAAGQPRKQREIEGYEYIRLC